MPLPILSTCIRALTLRQLEPEHAESLFLLVQANRDHLTAHGDYLREVTASQMEVACELSRSDDATCRFGIYLEAELIGRIDLLGVEPPKYGLGYWLDQAHGGRGYATAALSALLDFADCERQASDIFAGVSHGNERSAALLRRLGFKAVARFDAYTRFHKPIER